MINDCEDMSVCGSNCVGSGNSLDLSFARSLSYDVFCLYVLYTQFFFFLPHSFIYIHQHRILPVNNFAKNYLRFSVCDLDLDDETLYDIEVLSHENTSSCGFDQCTFMF
jgi:hypothetical protein